MTRLGLCSLLIFNLLFELLDLGSGQILGLDLEFDPLAKVARAEAHVVVEVESVVFGSAEDGQADVGFLHQFAHLAPAEEDEVA